MRSGTLKPLMIGIGNFLFKWRNGLFPVIVLILFAAAAPPATIAGSERLESVKDILALLVAGAGVAMRGVTIGYAYIKRGGLNKKVYADTLVTAGVFSLCRNPLYLGNMLIFAGIFLMHGNPLVLVPGIVLFVFIYQCIIYAEENFLESKFGDTFRAYCADVPRWLPRLSRFSDATEGMAFNLRRLIVKDYATFSTVVVAMALTEIYEYSAAPGGREAHGGYLMLMVALIVLSALWAVFFRSYRKKIKL